MEQLKGDLGYFRTVGIGLTVAERHFQLELVPRTAAEQLVLGVFTIVYKDGSLEINLSIRSA